MARSDFEDVRPDEVQVQVKAVSMHFKDVMLAMGMLGDFKPIIGMECAGMVTRVGSGITKFKVGDQVMCLAMSTSVGEERSALFGTKCISKERQTVLMPRREDLSFVEAAGFLGVMATAWHALVKVARLEKDDTVLPRGSSCSFDLNGSKRKKSKNTLRLFWVDGQRLPKTFFSP